MAHILRITDGTTTVTFTTSPIKLMEYNPQVSLDRENIQESVIVDFYSATQSTNFANIQAVTRLLEQAKYYFKYQQGPRVFVEFDPGTSGTIYRSLIHSGKSQPVEEMLKAKWFDNKNLKYVITWTRDPDWQQA